MPDPTHKHLAHISAIAPEPIVFFTVVTFQRRAVLANERMHDVLRGLWERSAEQNGWWVGDYILMPDHVHFFARNSRSADPMHAWMKMWKSVSARAMVKVQGIDGPVWQKDYFDRYLRSDENYSEKWNYVEANPVRAGLVTKVDDWRFRGRIHRLSM
jgi:putative transposase